MSGPQGNFAGANKPQIAQFWGRKGALLNGCPQAVHNLIEALIDGRIRERALLVIPTSQQVQIPTNFSTLQNTNTVFNLLHHYDQHWTDRFLQRAIPLVGITVNSALNTPGIQRLLKDWDGRDSVVTLVVGMARPWLALQGLAVVGFTTAGVTAGSLATSIGNVGAGSLFAGLQFMGTLRALTGPLGTVLAAAGSLFTSLLSTGTLVLTGPVGIVLAAAGAVLAAGGSLFTGLLSMGTLILIGPVGIVLAVAGTVLAAAGSLFTGLLAMGTLVITGPVGIVLAAAGTVLAVAASLFTGLLSMGTLVLIGPVGIVLAAAGIVLTTAGIGVAGASAGVSAYGLYKYATKLTPEQRLKRFLRDLLNDDQKRNAFWATSDL